MKSRNFVISCGTGWAMTHIVKEIKKIDQVSIEVTFEVKTYIDEEQTETFDETYIFVYGNINTIQHISTNGKSENIEEIFSESALRSFKEFGEKLFQILTD